MPHYDVPIQNSVLHFYMRGYTFIRRCFRAVVISVISVIIVISVISVITVISVQSVNTVANVENDGLRQLALFLHRNGNCVLRCKRLKSPCEQFCYFSAGKYVEIQNAL